MFGNHLKEYRERRGLSQVELARIAGVAGSNLNAIERGRLQPWTKMKKRLAKALRCEAEELFPEDGANGK